MPSKQPMLISKEDCEGLEAGHCREEVFHEIQPMPMSICNTLTAEPAIHYIYMYQHFHPALDHNSHPCYSAIHLEGAGE